jgi:glutathione S-transferase
VSVRLWGYRHSVYSWIARATLCAKGVAYDWTEVNPFSGDQPEEWKVLHPFGKVPVLQHDGFSLYETAAIARYVDEAFNGPLLQPIDLQARACMTQIVSIADSYVYWPLVRQVFSHRVFRPAVGVSVDENEARQGLEPASRILLALDALAGQPFLTGASLSLADLHLAPMLAYFAMAPEGRALLSRHERIETWLAHALSVECLKDTAPRLPRQ